jgi:hypothetical protein
MRAAIRVMIAGLLSLAAVAQASDAGGFAWKRDAGSVALVKGEQVIWQFRHGKEEAKPAFHPLAVLGGPVMTCYRNEDHPWHRGMWFSWKFINGLNYWEEDKAGVSEGLTEWRNVKIETRPDFTARITLDVAYRPSNGEAVLTEKRLIEVSAPDAQGIYRMDWNMTFKALGKDVLLDRTPIPGDPDGKAHGGYSGLAVRFARETANIQATTSDGPITFDKGGYRGKAIAADYSGVIENREVGIAFVGHPKNLNAPTPWWIIDNKLMKYFNPSVLCFGAHTLKAGESMTLRYRGLIHPGRWDAERLRTEADRYVKTQK